MASKAAGRIVLNEAQIKSLIAHREPFLFIQHAIDNDIGKSITTVAQLRPGQILSHQMQVLEGLGQTSALLLRQVRGLQMTNRAVSFHLRTSIEQNKSNFFSIRSRCQNTKNYHFQYLLQCVMWSGIYNPALMNNYFLLPE